MAAGGSYDGRHDDASGAGAGADLYAVLGLSKECTDAELRLAYRRLAMTWHPDRCSASGSSTRVTVEEAKERFQEIQGAYSGHDFPNSLVHVLFLTSVVSYSTTRDEAGLASACLPACLRKLICPRASAPSLRFFLFVHAVLSDSNKRLLYDVGVYDSDDDEQDVSGMGDFLGEMAEMMSQATPTETFEELQQLFVDTFQADLAGGFCCGPRTGHPDQVQSPPCTSRLPSWPSSSSPCPPPLGRADLQAPQLRKGTNKRYCSSATGFGMAPRTGRPRTPGSGPGLGLSGFCFKGSDWRQRDAPWTQDSGSISARKKQRLATSHDMSRPEQRRTL